MGDPTSFSKYFRDWLKSDFFLALWRAGLAEYDEMEGIAWKWQSIDGTMVKAPLVREAVGPNPTDRGKNGSTRHLLVDGRGAPLSLIVTGTNRHYVSQLAAVLDALILPRPDQDPLLYADRGYEGEPAERILSARGYLSRVRRKKRRRGRPPKNRRWVVEAVHSWFNRLGYNADIGGRERESGIRPTRLAEWSMRVNSNCAARLSCPTTRRCASKVAACLPVPVRV